MADNGVQALEGTEASTENTPSPAEEKKTEAATEAGAPVPAVEPGAAEAIAPVASQSTIRSIFLARAAASSAAVGGFAQMETADQGLAVRGAYLAHLSVTEETGAGETVSHGEVLRKAYVAHAVAVAVTPRAKRAASRPAKRGRKATKPAKPKRRAAGAAAPKAKKRGPSASKAKPRKRRGR